MSTPNQPPSTVDLTHPDQQEISTILDSFNKDPAHLSIVHLARDGVLRNLTADRHVLNAVGLSPRLVKAFLDRLPPDYRALAPEMVHVDGSEATQEQLWHPDRSLLPPPVDEAQKTRERERLRMWQERDGDDVEKTGL